MFFCLKTYYRAQPINLSVPSVSSVVKSKPLPRFPFPASLEQTPKNKWKSTMKSFNFRELGIEFDAYGRTAGHIKTKCPRCIGQRSNKSDKSLSVDLDSGLYKCHYCGWSGVADDGSGKHGGRKTGDPLVDFPAERNRTSPRPTAPDGTAAPQHPQKPANETPLTPVQLKWLADERHISAHAAEQLHITSSVQYMPQSGLEEPCLCFNYLEEGRLVNIKFRATLHKHFKMLTGAELIPYNIDGIKGTPECIITEGELDAAAFVTAGRTDVISVPGGANRNLKWMDRFVDSHFEDKRVIYIAGDADPKGEELKQELLRRLGRERCRVVSYGEGCKDANELLVKAGPEALSQALADAPEMPLEGVYTAVDVDEEMRILFENGLSRGAETGLKNLDDLCTFETGRLCVITGHPGDGKSEFTDELVLRLCLNHQWRTAYFSPENQPLPYHLAKLTEKLTGQRFRKGLMTEMLYEKAQRYLAENISSILPKEDFTVESIPERARQLVRRRGIRILVLDPFNRLEHRIPGGQTETQYISAFLDLLANFAQRHQCLVILVAHPRKMQTDPLTKRLPVPTLQDINGSAAFVNKCDFGLVIERDRQAGVTRVHVKKVKFRHLGNIGECSFVFNPVNGRYSPCEEDATAERTGDRIRNTQFDSKHWFGIGGNAETEKTLDFLP